MDGGVLRAVHANRNCRLMSLRVDRSFNAIRRSARDGSNKFMLPLKCLDNINWWRDHHGMSPNNVPKAVGRPRFRIDPDRLRCVRNGAHLTQAEVVELAYEQLRRRASSASVKHYQRIERHGNTSRAMAAALAAVLGTTVEVLQGAAPEESLPFIECLEQHFADQIARQDNKALADHLSMYGESSPRALAIQVAERIEAAMFGLRDEDLEDLARLTGWTVQQLMQPIVLHGHWLISSSPGDSVAKVLRGVSNVIWHTSQVVDKYDDYHECDMSISLRQVLSKFHVDVEHPRTRALRRSFSFVRCQPSATGLQWVKPNWQDQFLLDDGLRQWAYSNANFVTDFDGRTRPSEVRQLRLKVEEFVVESEAPGLVALIKGDLDELPESILRNFQVEGSSHSLALKWITVSGAMEIKALLATWPLECWTLRASGTCIDIDLNVPLSLALESGQKRPWGTKYVIRLVEELPNGLLEPVPWRSSSVEATCKELKRHMGMSAG